MRMIYFNELQVTVLLCGHRGTTGNLINSYIPLSNVQFSINRRQAVGCDDQRIGAPAVDVHPALSRGLEGSCGILEFRRQAGDRCRWLGAGLIPRPLSSKTAMCQMQVLYID